MRSRTPGLSRCVRRAERRTQCTGAGPMRACEHSKIRPATAILFIRLGWRRFNSRPSRRAGKGGLWLTLKGSAIHEIIRLRQSRRAAARIARSSSTRTGLRYRRERCHAVGNLFTLLRDADLSAIHDHRARGGDRRSRMRAGWAGAARTRCGAWPVRIEGGMKRRYTMDQYRLDVAKLYALRRSDAPGVSSVLTDALSADAELAATEVEELAPVSAIQRRRSTSAADETLQTLRGSGLRPCPGRAPR
jgi:hypothetical protein